MNTSTFFTLAAALTCALERKTAYVTGEIRLFKDPFVPDPTTVLADLTAAEATYDTYAAAAVAAWNTPILGPTSGYLITHNSVQFNTGTTDPAVGNVINGAWYEDATNNVRLVTTFDPGIPMQVAYQGFEFAFVDFFPTGYTG